MKYFRKVPIIKEKVIRTCCDSCGLEIQPSYDYQMEECTIKMRHGSRYPECDSTEVYEADLCKECFSDKLIPFLESIGVERKWYENDSYSMSSKGYLPK